MKLGYGSNMLLNVGPMPNGKIQCKHVEKGIKMFFNKIMERF